MRINRYKQTDTLLQKRYEKYTTPRVTSTVLPPREILCTKREEDSYDITWEDKMTRYTKSQFITKLFPCKTSPTSNFFKTQGERTMNTSIFHWIQPAINFCSLNWIRSYVVHRRVYGVQSGQGYGYFVMEFCIEKWKTRIREKWDFQKG